MEPHTAPGRVGQIREHAEIIEEDLRIIATRAVTPAYLLDVGAGPATFVTRALGQGSAAIALDIEPSAGPLWAARQIPGVLGDGFRLPFRAGAFGVVRIKEVIEHVEDPLALLAEATRVLARNGRVIAHVPSPWSQYYPVANFWDDYTHVRPLTRRGLQRLFEDGGMVDIEIGGYVAGRNAAERAIGSVIGRFIPHTYRVVARRA